MRADYLLGLTSVEHTSRPQLPKRPRTRKAVTASVDAVLSLEAGYRAMAAENRQLAEEALATAAEVLS